MQSNDVNAAAVNGKEAAYFGVPWEDAYGYAQAIKVGDTIHVSGQLSHDEKGNLIAPASLDESGKPAEFSMMEQQMRATYANAVKLLARFGERWTTSSRIRSMSSMWIGVCRRRQGAQGSLRHRTPSCAGNLIGVTRLAFPEQLIEIAFKAVLSGAEAKPR
jgi:enamine deaminase RidA (YjgF/YER057c/UK114 family)